MKHIEARAMALEVLHDASVTLRYLAPSGHTLEMCQRPDYWRNNLRELGQQRVVNRNSFNRIEILAEDGSWEAELRVISIADGLVNFRVLREWQATNKPGRKATAPDGYVIEHIPSNGWRAMAPSGVMVAGKLTLQDDAIQAAIDHAKKAAPAEPVKKAS